MTKFLGIRHNNTFIGICAEKQTNQNANNGLKAPLSLESINHAQNEGALTLLVHGIIGEKNAENIKMSMKGDEFMKLKEQIAATELKLLLDSKQALQKKDTLSDDLNTLFKFDEESGQMSIWYLETPAEDLRKARWSVRYRKYGDGSGLELTFKKRFSERDYKAMLESEAAKMFSAEFTPEIDMEYTNKTYSLSFERVFTDIEDELTEPEAKRLAMLNSPPVFTDWGSKNTGFSHLCASTLLGPVVAATYTGEFEGLEAKLEIWKLKSYLTELSFDVSTKKSVQLKRNLLKVLTDYKLLLTENLLKTDAFLDYFGKKSKASCNKDEDTPTNQSSSQA